MNFNMPNMAVIGISRLDPTRDEGKETGPTLALHLQVPSGIGNYNHQPTL
ncbi:MAG: hypothetical protein IPM17_12635 [Verrucomicrobia bacterium]|jgi:hypothetical protein|nr:hypothetical protein [Verrucomicrobiota bacterium]